MQIQFGGDPGFVIPIRDGIEMHTISFMSEFIDALLSGTKRQTTRAQTSRIKVGDVCTIYDQYYTHLLGKVKITDVIDLHPCDMSQKEIEAWALADGFSNFATARCWFEIRYGARWMHQWWTVIRWDGWLERYFEPTAELPKVAKDV